MKLFSLISAIIFCTSAVIAQTDGQISSCYLFVDLYNNSATGFSEYRKDMPDTAAEFELDDILFTAYQDLELGTGMIYKTPHQTSTIFQNYYYTKWEFNVEGKALYPNVLDQPWEVNKVEIEPYFTTLCNWIHDNCVGQLQMSPIYDVSALPNSFGVDKLTCYLYHPAITSPEGLTTEQSIQMLEQVPSIKINVYENWFPKGTYRMEYSVIGIQQE